MPRHEAEVLVQVVCHAARHLAQGAHLLALDEQTPLFLGLLQGVGPEERAEALLALPQLGLQRRDTRAKRLALGIAWVVRGGLPCHPPGLRSSLAPGGGGRASGRGTAIERYIRPVISS